VNQIADGALHGTFPSVITHVYCAYVIWGK